MAVKKIKVGNWKIDTVHKISGFKDDWEEKMEIEVFDETKQFAIIINDNWYWIDKKDWKKMKMI